MIDKIKNSKFTLYDILTDGKRNDGDEIIIQDDKMFFESYFYVTNKENYHELDNWDKLMIDLSKLLAVKSMSNNIVTVSFYDLIKSKIDDINKSNLFVRRMTTEDIIDEDLNPILSGYVTETWLMKFVNLLSNEDK